MSLRSFLPILTLAGGITACSPSEQELRERDGKIYDLTQEYGSKGLGLCNRSGLFHEVTTENIGTAEFARNARSYPHNETMPGATIYEGGYTASSSPLLGIEGLKSWEIENFKLLDYVTYNDSVPSRVAGLPPSLAGKEVNITSKIPTNAYPYAVHLGADDTEKGSDNYKVASGTITLQNGATADTVTILGPMDYCWNNDSRQDGGRMNANHRVCTETLGQLTVIVKPDDFDSRCADVRLQLEQAIKAIR